MKLRRWQTVALVGIAASGAATALTLSGVAFAQTQTQLVSAYLSTGLPLADPASQAWAQAQAIEVPLTPQAGVLPSLAQSTIPTMQVRSLNDGKWVAFRLEWPDATKDELAIGQDQFRDAGAIQMPVDQTIPGVCMGVRGQPVNLWHWKADWQNDIDNGFQDLMAQYPNFWKDYYPFVVGSPPFKTPDDFASADARRFLVGWAAGNPLSDPARLTPVEELIAHGFGTATHSADQGVLGRGQWADGRWSVVFARPLVTASETQAQLTAGGRGTMAVAAWNGSNKEVGARKQISADFTFALARAPAPAAPTAAPVVTPGGPTVASQPMPQGPNNWWIVVPVGLVVVAGAFGAGSLGVYYLWYKTGKAAKTS